MWRQVLGRLAERAAIDYVERPGEGRRRWMRRPDVWLSDGHQGPLEVEGPRVIQLLEASWHLPETRSNLEPWFLEAFEEPSRQAAITATRIITPSESSRRQVVEAYGVGAEAVDAIPLGVDRTIFQPGLRGGPEVVASASGDPPAPYVLCVSQIHPRKNLRALVAAISELTRRGFPHQLVIVGAPASDGSTPAGALAEDVADPPGTPRRITLLHNLSEHDLARVMAGCAAFCLPSFMEGFGLPVLEAMACGAPVVVSDRGSLPEVVADAGIVALPTAEAIAEALAGVLKTPEHARSLGARASARAAEFGWERTARGWLKALEEAVDGRI